VSGRLDGAAFRLATLAARRFPEGGALDAYLDGGAGLADYLRCGEPGCRWGVEPGSVYCRSHKIERQRAQQREYKARRKAGIIAARPPCCPATRRCDQHDQAAIINRGYVTAWASGTRGGRRVDWLYDMLGRDAGDRWGRGWDAAGWLDQTDRGPDEGATRPGVIHPCPWRDDAARRWFAGHLGWVNHPLPETAGATWLAASRLRPELDRLAEIHQIRRVNGFGPWIGEKIHLLLEEACSG
jgi:hypothetical protein